MRSSGSSGWIRLYLGYRVSLLSNLISANHDLFAVIAIEKSCGNENDGAAWRDR